MTRLAGRTALITGGGTGIARATAGRFADEGATVFMTGRRHAELDAAVEDIGTRAIAVRADITSTADLDRLYATIAERTGRLDVFYANAGVRLKVHGIRVNVLSPGPTDTPMLRTLLSDAEVAEFSQWVAGQTPSGHSGNRSTWLKPRFSRLRGQRFRQRR
uniref:SDR family NAD(P)-dependent oxidoreductase n=1 Tax=Paractinoplanes polyasparticus TaxID=2856853 RepID=UPI00210298F1|nr:SDR family NAD(P)-dependent oxidoreductase [Actinoplanes polyasparticus]